MQASRASLQAGGLVLLAAALLAAPVTSAAANTWLTVTPDGEVRVNDEAVPQAPRVVVGRYDGAGLNVTVYLAGLEFALRQTKGGEFVVVGGPKVSFGGRIGEPALPVVRRLVIVPEGATVELAVTEGRSGLIDLEAIGFSRHVMPMQPPIPMIPGALERAPFHYNEAAYTADELLPAGRVVLTELGIVRGHHLHLLEVHPVAYNPVRGILMVWPHIDVDIGFHGGGRGGGLGLMPPLRDVLLNPPPPAGPIGRGSGNYLIVAADAYAAGAPMTEFISAKTDQGFDVTTHSVEPGTTNEAIKTYIESLWGTSDAPDYLLLVGDVDTVPHWVGQGDRAATTDLPYACMDAGNDWYPDIAIGRFSVRSVSQLQNVVDKTLFIEAGNFADPNYTRHAAFLSGMDVNSGDEEAHNWVIDTYMTPKGIAGDKLYQRTYGATTQDVEDSFNAGCVYGVFYGHAGPGPDGNRIWQNGPPFYFDDLYGLDDGAICTLVLHVTCNVGKYALWDECFTEAWLRAPFKGAAVNIGPSEFIYSAGHGGEPGWVETSDLYKFVFDSIYLDGVRELGPAWHAALLRLLAAYGPANPICRDYFELFNLMGDPSLRVPEPTKNYLVVTPELYVDSEPLSQFINGKTARGFHVSTYEVPSGTSRSTIKTYIEDLWGTPYAPDYILLVGDTDGSTAASNTIPHWTGGGSKSATTDLPYACMDAGDDWYPDIAIGRFSVRSVSQLQDVVDKTLFVEAGNFPDPDYVKRGAFLANPSTYGTAEPTHDWVIETYFEPNDYEGIKIYSSQGGDTQDVTDAVNAGCLFAVYFGHSSSSGWWDPSFNASNVQALSNQGLYGLVLGWSCNTARFDYDECVGETWLREANKGAAAFISASNYIYWGSAEAWEHSVVHEKASFAAFFEDDIWEVGPAWEAGLYRYLKKHGHWDGNPQNPPQQNADVIRNFFEEFVLLGDPGLRLPQPDGFTLTPAPLSQDLCCPPTNQAVFTIEVGQMGDFAEVVTLTTDGEPAGTTVDFDVNSQPPPFTATMTIDGLIGAAPGDYNIVITGTPTGGTERSTEVTLNISNAVPGAVSLSSPPNGATDVSRIPTLIWQPSSQAVEYDLEIATDSGFTNVVYSTTVTETSHTVGVSLDSITLYHWHVRANNGCGDSGFSAAFNFTTLEQADYFTEEFINDFDLENFTVEFIPDGSGDYYDMCGSPATGLPTDPALGTILSLTEDAYATITLLGAGQVQLYGVSYDTFYVGDNGYITFTGGDNTWTESLDAHFNMPRISALFDDLSAPNGGTISWRELGDRVAVTWEDVPEYTNIGSNTFQVEMFFDGEIHITWLQVDSNDSIVGLSEGNGVPEVPFPESDISMAPPCDQESAFSLDAEPASQDICAPADAVYTIKVESFLGFDEPVTLDTTGEPAGSDVDFSANPVRPPGTTVMTVGNTDACSPGAYSIEITGTAQGGMQRSTDVGLNLSTAAPDGVTLTSPPNGEDNVSRSPTLIWQASSQALEYDLEVATDFNFTKVVYYATVADSNHTVSITLDLATPYYWHVRANNACGTSGYSSPFSFTTMNMLLPVTYDMLNGEAGTYTYFDDAYDGDGDNTVPLAPLSGGLGDLTDGVIATKHWNSTPGPYVGWQTVDPTITFHFADPVNIDSITLYLDDSGGGGSVQPPDDVTVSMGGAPLVFPVSDPPGDEPFAFTCDDLGLAGDTLELTIADYNAGAYMMLSEVEFYGGPNTGACCVGETCSVMAEDECLAGEGEYQGDGTDCDPNPCIAYESACLIISEVVNGVESGGCPTWIEITNTGLTDFSFIEGGVIIQTDSGNGVDVDVDLSGVTILAGQSYVINSNQLGACTGAFPLIYGFDADFYTEVPFGDGDDRYIITDTADGSSLLDIYGEFGVDGTGEPWEYTEGYAYRLSPYNFGNGQDFPPGEWFYGGVGSLVGDNPTQLLLENTTPGIHVYDRDCIPGQYETLRPLAEDAGFDPCNSDEECPYESHCVPSPVSDPPGPGTCYAPKTRYLSIVAHPDQLPNTARRIRLQDGTVLGWVGVPAWIPPASQHSGLWLSPVSDAPVYDGVGFTGLWPTLLHVSDCEIAPGYTYEVQAIVQGRDIGVEGNYSEALALNTNSTWGDTVTSGPGGLLVPPDGVIGLADVLGAITKFQGVDSAPMTWLDIAPSGDADNPDQIVGLGDIMACIGGFQGQPYPGNGPLNCP